MFIDTIRAALQSARLGPTSVVAALLAMTLLLFVERAGCKDTWRLSEDAIGALTLRPDRWDGVLAWRIVDGESDRDLGAVNWRRLLLDGNMTDGRPVTEARWAGLHENDWTYCLETEGYRPLRIDGLRVARDSVVFVLASLERGAANDTVYARQVEGEWTCCLETHYSGIDSRLTTGTVAGVAYDIHSRLPIPDVSVYCEETATSASTDDIGYYFLRLDTLKRVALQVWHPAYDSIRFEFSKHAVKSSKRIDLYLSPREPARVTELAAVDDSTVPLLVVWENWGSGWTKGGFRESQHSVFTYRVRPGEVFGPTSFWIPYECLPFRLVKTFPDRRAWVQFTRDLGPIGVRWREDFSNFLTLSDTAVALSTHTADAGSTVTLQLLPDYSPGETVAQRVREALGKAPVPWDPEPPPPSECDTIKAAVERAFMKYQVSLIEGDFEAASHAFSDRFYSTVDHAEPSPQLLEQRYPPEKRLQMKGETWAELFDPRRTEFYVHELCNQAPHAHYVDIMTTARVEPAPGDVLIQIPSGYQHRPHGVWRAVFRLEGDCWKILAW